MWIRALFLFPVIFTAAGLSAQTLLFRNISAQLELPSMETYGLWQDREGGVWISTETGIFRYNGTSLQMMTGKGSTEREAAYGFAETEDGTLWMGTSKHRILRYHKGRLWDTPYTKPYRQIMDSAYSAIYWLSYPQKGMLYVHSALKTVEIDLYRNRMRVVASCRDCNYMFLKKNGVLLPVDHPTQASGQHVRIYVAGEKDTLVITDPHEQGQNYLSARTLTGRLGDTLFFTYNNKLIRLNPDGSHTVYRYPGRILYLYTDSDHGFWVGVLKDGVYYYKNGFDNYLHALEGYSVSAVLEDRENSIWCNTLEKGVFFCRNKNVIDYSAIESLNKKADVLTYENGHVLAVSGDRLADITPAAVKLHPIKGAAPSRFTDLVYHKGEWLLGGTQDLVRADKTFNRFRYKGLPGNGIKINPEHFFRDPNGELYFSTLWAVGNFSSTTYTYRDMKPRLPGRLKREIVAGRDSFYAATSAGVYFFGFDDTTKFHRVRGTHSLVHALIRDRQGLVWAAGSAGLFVFRPEDETVMLIDRVTGMHNPYFYTVTEDRYGQVWAGADQGLLKISRRGNRFTYRVYKEHNGLLSSYIYRATADSQHLYLSTAEGLCSFPLLSEPGNIVSPAIRLSNRFLAENAASGFSLPYHRNSPEFEFDVSAFKGGELYLRYRLIQGNDSLQKTVRGNRVLLQNLEPGPYRLEVAALNSDGVASVKPVVLHFRVEAPFWMTLRFYLLCALFFVLALFLGIRRYGKYVREKEQKKAEINRMLAESQLSALQAQMNPHFIFNAINSIQNYILKKKEEDAYTYLAKFGRLIRMVLQQSREKIVTLEQELETLALYVELEQLRFRDRFRFEMQIDPEVDPSEIKVPVMLMQPYIENAIWHGFMQLGDKRTGLLKLRISFAGEHLHIRIEDNGIGRHKAAESQKNSRHKSAGTLITEQWLQMICRIQGFENTRISVTDLYTDGRAAGTRVEIFIAKNLR